MTRAGTLDRIRAVIDAAERSPGAKTADARAVALGWATVDLDRAVARLARELAMPAARFQEVPESVALGARCRSAGGALPGGASLVVTEPATEGRLAASLARLGEGPVAVWLGVPDTAVAAAALAATGVATSAERPGPFGPERLVVDGPSHGPHRLLVRRPTGTIQVSMTDPSQLSLRPAQPGDAGAIAALFTDEGYPAGPSDIVARLEHFGSPMARVIVAEHDDAILGFIAVHALPRFEHDDWILRILALVVDAGARERGVGRALMSEAERIGTELGAAFVELTAGHHRPEARHLYESLGYDSTVTAYLRKKL